MLTDADDGWLEVVGNLRKARSQWERMSRILGLEGSDPHISGNFYKVVVQAALFFGADNWVITPSIGSTLG